MSLGIFREIERLVEYIPITAISDGMGRLSENTNIDSRFYFKDIDGVAVRFGIIDNRNNTISMRDIIKLLNKFLKNAKIEEIIENPSKYRKLQNSGSGFPLKTLLFDFCLSALSGDIHNSKLFLAHSLYLLGLRRHIVLVLSAIINEPLLITTDNDVRQMLTYLAVMTEPDNIDMHFDKELVDYSSGYTNYLQELQKISVPSINKKSIAYNLNSYDIPRA